MGTRPIRELHFGIEQIEALPKVRKRRLELSLVAQHHSERHVRPDETGRIVEPFGHTHRLLGEMLRLLQLEEVRMVALQAAERRDFPGKIPELPTQLPGPRIGRADVGVAVGLGRVQGGTKSHLQIQLTLGPLV